MTSISFTVETNYICVRLFSHPDGICLLRQLQYNHYYYTSLLIYIYIYIYTHVHCIYIHMYTAPAYIHMYTAYIYTCTLHLSGEYFTHSWLTDLYWSSRVVSAIILIGCLTMECLRHCLQRIPHIQYCGSFAGLLSFYIYSVYVCVT